MLLYSDIISGDEMFSDAFPLKEVDDIVFEVDCQLVTVKAGADVDIGANPSAEEADEALEEGSSQVNNVVHSFRLQQTSYDKKSYLSHLKGYMKAVKSELQNTKPERVEHFEKGAQAYAKKIVANFKDYEFYVGESMNPDATVALLNFRADGITPYFTFWKDGLKETKL
ncbi:hypothetical protein FRB96_000099 [Tulasnella sp. 330]|nr:hypothetical protein FRB96_000099 [Tulasnella sp. 330]KAG8882918.1 hypothetical protein FRB97_007514 [Tulasnella sp. 331]